MGVLLPPELDVEQRRLKFHFGACALCWDTGVWWTPTRGFERCPDCYGRGVEFSAAALKLSAALWLRSEKHLPIEPQTFQCARYILHASADMPISGFSLQAYLCATPRDVKAAVEELRADWLLPIGSSRGAPHGYYWIRSAAEYLAWSRSYRAQAIQSLVTMHRLGAHNFAELAGQDSFSFAREIEREIEEALI